MPETKGKPIDKIVSDFDKRLIYICESKENLTKSEEATKF